MGKNEWSTQWEKIFLHYQNDTRHAYYINAILEPQEMKLLELGAGSFRDMAALNRLGRLCHGVDYSEQSVTRARELHPDLADLIHIGDVFNLDFQDCAFDFTYQNGLLGYFCDDDVRRMLYEQARISKYRLALTVHNAHNKQFVSYFDSKKHDDPLYSIRFFSIDEIMELARCISKVIRVIPVGKQKKYYEDDLINIGLSDRESLRKSFDYHGVNLIDMSERIMVVCSI